MEDTKQPVSSQPQDTAPMSVGGNRNAKNCPIGSDGVRDWSFGLFDCFGRCGLCCWATWCPCVVYGKNRQRLRSLRKQGTPLPGGGVRYDRHCCIFGALEITGYNLGMQIHTREQVRERYSIRGNSTEDCAMSLCCRPCALTQERREIELEENSF
ncbi:PLAC8-domain-containing protein [Russula ochroleuca]|uniref:PLAC8-domain-containing protein n=1 Tax=Russula ochroleuca TaxID=152965 RepID=A0A9P5MQQ2_9AGAM|nr:PLAC8-domain-containing protein [Russula ochroleuca]